jgi:excisionase family DNA binding protein
MSSNIKIQKTCENCGMEYTAKTLVTRYCSHTCNRRHYKKIKKEEKLNNYLEKKISPSHKTTALSNQNLDKEYLSLVGAALMIGTSKRTIQRLISTGKLKASKIGRRTIIKKSEIDNLFKYS